MDNQKKGPHAISQVPNAQLHLEALELGTSRKAKK